MSCLQCPKKLWLELYRPELGKNSVATETVFAMGNTLGIMARSIYDPESRGTTIDLPSLGVTKALAQTVELVKERKPVFEAGFSANGALAFADALLPVQGGEQPGWRMVEVKGSTSVKSYQRDDVAVQAFVARKSGLPLFELAIAHIDSTWVYEGENDYNGLLVEVDLTEEAFGRGAEVETWIANAQTVAAKQEEPMLKTGEHCNDPFACSFTYYCASLAPQPQFPAEWLPRKSAKLKKLIYMDGLQDMRHVPNEELSSQQLRVKTHTLEGTTYFNAAGAAADLEAHGFPAFFLDFETINFSVPIWKGTRPYQQIPFQFSLHRLNHSGELEHQSFLDLSGSDPSKLFAEAVLKACEDDGPIYVYNAAFESHVIKELAGRFPELNQLLQKIIVRMVDLLKISQNHYYHPDMRGSWSIKAVLPCIAPTLNYGDLSGVKDGGMAQVAYQEAIQPDTATVRRAEIRTELIDYCKLDTYAMVRLWRHFAGRHDLEI